MRAVVVREHGGTDRLLMEDRPRPVPAADEVLVEVRACALNHLDLWVRRGIPGHKFPLPLVPGSDVAGVVALVGATVKNTRPGDRVAVSPGLSCGTCAACLSGQDNLCRTYGILGETRDGGCAEFALVPAANVIPIPDGFSFPEAAAVNLAFLTAWHMLVARAGVRPGEDVLVHAAGSGVGIAAIQVARLLGARVIATAGFPEKCARARELGAEIVVNYRAEDFAARVREVTGKRGVDVVVEHVGEATWEGSIRSLARGGRLVLCGATSGADVRIDLKVLFFKSLSLLGSTMGSKGELLEVWRHVRAGRLRPIVDRVLPLSEVREAHRVLEDRAAFGKVVLEP